MAIKNVILCKDCEWFNTIGCAIMIVDDTDKPTGHDFCSFAVRKVKENKFTGTRIGSKEQNKDDDK